MKFQNPSLNSVLNGRKDERTSRKQYAPHFFKVGGIKRRRLTNCMRLVMRKSVASKNIKYKLASIATVLKFGKRNRDILQTN